MARGARRAARYVSGFALARGALFGAPILLANLLTPSVYGLIELAQAAGALGAVLLGLGVPAAVPLILIRKVENARWDALLLFALCVSALLLCAGAAMLAAGADALYPLAAAAICALLLQGIWSTVLKSREMGELALGLETGFWVSAVIGASVAMLLAAGPGGRSAAAMAGVATYAAGLLAWTLVRYLPVAAPLRPGDMTFLLLLGAPLMSATLLSMLVSTSGRLLLGGVADAAAVGTYAVLLRATALPIVGHQMVVIALFRRLFEWPSEVLRRRAPVVIVAVATAVIVFWALVDTLGWMLGPRFAEAFAAHRSAALLILVQCILWSAIALNDLVNNRERTAGRVLRWSLGYVLVAFPVALAVLAVRDEVTLEVFVPVHAGLMLGYYLAQSAGMAALGLGLWRLWGLSAGSFVLLGALTFVL